MEWLQCCSNKKEKQIDPKREICRLKMNWFFMTVLAGLFAVSYTSVSSSFHQFITNPREENINRSLPGTAELEAGLGESEAFYSWVITVFNVGAIIGSLAGGLLLKWVPYWHLVLGSLCLHTLGYILYAVAAAGWLIMVSKLMSGVFIGAEMTLALAYFGESSNSYRAAIRELGKNERSAARVKHRLFALHSVGANVGYIFGPGVAVIFAQFPINQFRSIAWYNAVLGLAIIVTQLFIFRGESSCKGTNCSKTYRNRNKRNQIKQTSEKCIWDKCVTISLLVFLVVGRAVLSFRFCVYETLFNPILSDSFGLNERDASYFFFGLVAAQICGTIVLLVLQGMRVSNRLMAVMGLVMSIVATLLMGDWQAARSDPCTQASLYHHPDLLHTYTLEIDRASSDTHDTGSGGVVSASIECEQLNLSVSLQHHLKNTAVEVYAYPNSIVARGVLRYGCEIVAVCQPCAEDEDRPYSATATCLHLHINTQQQCLERAPLSPWQPEPLPLMTSYSCTKPHSLFTYCLSSHQTLSGSSTAGDDLASIQEEEEEYISTVHLQSVEIVEGRVEQLASQHCEGHSSDHRRCHWNPNSVVTHRECEDCPLICRDRTNYLEFPQFTIAAALLLISVPLARVPITSILSDIVSPEQQGLIMGLAQALNAVARSVGPLWLDAAYEGMQKRTFLAMGLCLVCYSLVLIGVLLVYPKLATPLQGKSVADGDSDSDSDYTAMKQMDSFSDSDFVP